MRLAPILVFGFLITASPLARADVPPPDSCTTVGAACDKAPPGYNQPGTCVSSTCTRPTPDGSMTYTCSRCVAGTGSGGAAGTGGGAGTGGRTTSDASTHSSSTLNGGCGCTLADGRAPTPGLFAAAIGLGWLAARRRRRS